MCIASKEEPPAPTKIAENGDREGTTLDFWKNNTIDVFNRRILYITDEAHIYSFFLVS